MKRHGLFVAASLLSIGCIVDAHRSGGTTGNGTGNGTASPQPLVAVISADKTMTANPGDGVGVFIEYKRGGSWHVWWTCDTNKSQQSCSFDVKISPTSGSIANLQGDHLLPTDQAKLGADGSIEATSNTAANSVGVTFDTAPGARILLDASIAGVPKSGDYIFFVAQNAKGEETVNGDFMGTLTNPIYLEPNAP
jgi:hypothetical protein